MKLIPRSMARRSTRLASSGSLGLSQIPRPVIRMAPKPSLWTGRSPPMANVPLAAALTVVTVLIQLHRLTSPPKVSEFSPCHEISLRNSQRHCALHRNNIVLANRPDQQMRGPRFESELIDQPVSHIGGGQL